MAIVGGLGGDRTTELIDRAGIGLARPAQTNPLLQHFVVSLQLSITQGRCVGFEREREHQRRGVIVDGLTVTAVLVS